MTVLVDQQQAIHPQADGLDAGVLLDTYADLVWANLYRLGVRESDLEDMLQEVFVVVHQRLHTYDPNASLTSWLFGIAVRVASAYRRKAYRRHETTSDAVIDDGVESDGRSPEQVAVDREASEQLREILDEMDLEKRAVFVMFEIDEMSGEQIATALGIPPGTVHSRLHHARKEFDRLVKRSQARQARRAP